MDQTRQRPVNSEGLDNWGILGLILAALALRVTNLESQSLWVDEGITYIWATLPLDEVVSQLLLVARQTPFYYTLVRLWIWAAGSSAFALRFLSAWASTLTVPLVYVAGKRAHSQRVGLLAAALLALNPFHIWYAQEARMYALAVLLSAAILFAFIQALRRPGWTGWLILAFVSGLGYLVHWFTFTLAAAQFVVFLARLNVLYLRFRRWVAVQVIAVLPTLAWVTVALDRRGTTNLRAEWIPQPSLLAPLHTFCNFSLGYTPSPSPPLLIGWGLFLAAFVLAFRVRPASRWRPALLAWMAVPVGATYLVSLHRSVYVDRYVSVALPAFVLWLALGVRTLAGRWRIAFTSALLAASLLASLAVLSGRRYQKENWRTAIGHVRETATAGDRLVVADPEDVPVSHYYLEDALPLETGLPEPSPSGRTWFLYRLPAESNHELGEPVGSSFAHHADPDVQSWLAAYSDQLVDRRRYCGLELFLLGKE